MGSIPTTSTNINTAHRAVFLFVGSGQAALTCVLLAEDRLIESHDSVDKTSSALFDAGQDQLALTYITESSSDAARSALELGNALLGSIEARTRVLYGLRAPESSDISLLGHETVRCD